jgi:hypothetical protein
MKEFEKEHQILAPINTGLAKYLEKSLVMKEMIIQSHLQIIKEL